MTWFFETYGCQMNAAESAALEQLARERGWQRAERGEDADLVLLNTCAVRATAERRVLGRIARYAAIRKKREKTGRPLVLVLAGCMAQRLGEGLKTAWPVDFVMGTRSRHLFPAILEEAERGTAREFPGSGAAGFSSFPPVNTFNARDDDGGETAFSFSPLHLDYDAGGKPAIRAFVPIMHGCDNFCSYCIVPYVRGREVSRSPEEILRETGTLAGAGVREITLLGQNVNSYRFGETDFPGILALLARQLAGSPIRRLRFLSANPRDFQDRTVAVLAENPLFCRHIHLCVQHGSNRILGLMNRRYTREDYLALAEKIRDAMPGSTLSTDILVGFPGETEEDFDECLRLMEEVRFAYAYMYQYNPREGTKAAALPGRVSEETKRERLSRVIALQKKHTKEILEGRIGQRETVLVEGISRKNADELLCRTGRDEMAVVPGPAGMIGHFADTTLASLRGNTFRGRDTVFENE